jgi:NTP pyrophosphatase (non-canonical NTP hydrolase)
MTARAVSVRAQLEAYEEQSFGRTWTVEELLIGLVGDLGDLAKAIQAREGIRALDDPERRLEHELSDVLWSAIVLADRCGVDLAAAFLRTMDEIEVTLSTA